MYVCLHAWVYACVCLCVWVGVTYHLGSVAVALQVVVNRLGQNAILAVLSLPGACHLCVCVCLHVCMHPPIFFLNRRQAGVCAVNACSR